MNGSPRAGISLAFTPQPDTAGNGGYGVTDEQGKFSLTSSDGREGIPPGDYRVLLTQLTLPDGSPIPDGASAADVGAVNQLPDIYNDPERSPVTASVSETQAEPIAIEVRDQ